MATASNISNCTHGHEYLRREERPDPPEERACADGHRPDDGREELAGVDKDGAEAGDDGGLPHQRQGDRQAVDVQVVVWESNSIFYIKLFYFILRGEMFVVIFLEEKC